MAIEPLCDICDNELKEFGGILCSPENDSGLRKKMHICVGCYGNIEQSCDNPQGSKECGVLLSPPDAKNYIKFTLMSAKCYEKIKNG